EMLAVSVEQELQQEQAALPSQRRRQWGLAAAGILAASILGFGLVYLFSPDPNAQLLADLPLLERVDEYRQIDDVEFLSLLYEAGVFAAAPPQPLEPTSLEDRKMLVQSMSAAEKQALKEKQERFLELSAAEQDRLRHVHAQLEAHPQSAHL